MSKLPVDVDAYLAGLPDDVRPLLTALRKAIKTAAPQAEELIAYGMPTYKFHGTLVHFVMQKKHCSFIVVGKAVVEAFARELDDFDISGTTIHFTPEQPLPASLVKKLVKARMAENMLNEKARIAARKNKP